MIVLDRVRRVEVTIPPIYDVAGCRVQASIRQISVYTSGYRFVVCDNNNGEYDMFSFPHTLTEARLFKKVLRESCILSPELLFITYLAEAIARQLMPIVNYTAEVAEFCTKFMPVYEMFELLDKQDSVLIFVEEFKRYFKIREPTFEGLCALPY